MSTDAAAAVPQRPLPTLAEPDTAPFWAATMAVPVFRLAEAG